MDKELKFKKEWFEVLNRCDRCLRMDVMEAVFQYFFTGAVPDFTDDARIIAFGFIRADIDAARRRREMRAARQKKGAQSKLPEAAQCAPQAAPAPKPAKPITYQEKEYLCSLLYHWNDSVKDTDTSPITLHLPLDCADYAPALEAIRRMPYPKVYEAVSRLRHKKVSTDFATFFNGL